MWGRTLYTLIDNNNSSNHVSLWDYDGMSLEALCDQRVPLQDRLDKHVFGKKIDHEISCFYPSVSIDNGIEAFNISKDDSLKRALDGKDMVFMVVPSVAMRETLEIIAKYIKMDATVVSCSKGLEEKTNLTHSQIMEEVLPKHTKKAVLSGPNIAVEIADNQPTATVIAARDKRIIREVISVFSAKNFKPTGSYDVLGVELAGAFKNIVAIGSGLCDGLGYKMNSKASLITRGLAEMSQLFVLYGARIETLYAGLAGIGDLIATSMSDNSRNHRFGVKIANGLSMDQALAEIGQVVEGVHTLKVANDIVQKDNSMPYPIIKGLYGVIYENKDPSHALEEILRTPGTFETFYLGKMILNESISFLDPDAIVRYVKEGYKGEELRSLLLQNSLRNYYKSLIRLDDKD